MNDRRTAKAAELRNEANTHRDRADALVDLGRRIRRGDMPVERWRPYWASIVDECKRQATNARAYAAECDERAATVDMAVSARNGWQPAPGATNDS